MSLFLNILVIINFLATIYLTYLVYKKNSSKNNSQLSEQNNQSDNKIISQLDNVTQMNLKSIQKVSLTRFNPFDDVGGDQSFILCLLDKLNNGIILTSLHSKDLTRTYAKAIKNGEGDGSLLSKEEKSAIVKTIKI